MPFQPNDPNTKVETTGASSYADYRIDSSFENDLGIAIMPRAQRTPGNRMIRLHGGYGVRRVKWRAERASIPPIIPMMTNTPGDTLVSASVVVPLPSPNQDAQGFDWQISGEYVYAQNKMRLAGQDPLPGGCNPWLEEPQSSMAYDLSVPYIPIIAATIANNEATGSNDNPNAAFINAVSANALVIRGGQITWPFTTLPKELSSNHIIQG